MMKWNLIFPALTAGLFIWLFSACSPTISTKTWKTYSPLAADADFMVFEQADTVPEKDSENLGQIILNKKNSDYPSALDTMIAIARSWGANALKINKHEQALDIWLGRPVHRLNATALRLSNLNTHLKTLNWSERRHLRKADFLADTANRPFIAVTATSLFLYWEIHPTQKELIISTKAIFTRPLSYFKYRIDSLDVLAHEQGHFDIAEVFARKFRQSLIQQSFEMKTLDGEIRRLYEDNYKAMQEFQDHYDHDVYAFPKRQKDWLIKIKSELDRYANYRQDKLVLKLKS